MAELIPSVAIRPSYITIFNQIIGGKISEKSMANQENLKDNKYKGIISPKAAGRIRNYIDWFLIVANPRMCYSKKVGRSFNNKLKFITLTLSAQQNHSDLDIKKKLMSHFTIEAAKKWGVKEYMWKAETQANGNIHFHVIVDKYIHWRSIRTVWNRIQNKLGYVETYRQKHCNLNFEQYLALYPINKYKTVKDRKRAFHYGLNTHWSDPNSTDVHNLKEIKNIKTYFSKYFCKNEPDKRQVKGRLWFLSTSLSHLKKAASSIGNRVLWELQKLENTYRDRVKQDEFYTVIAVNVQEWMKLNLPGMQELFELYFFQQRKEFIPQLKLI